MSEGGYVRRLAAHPSPILGADFSAYQSVEHVAQLAPRLKFAFVKLTEGTGYRNPLAREQAHALTSHGVLVGAYHFLRPQDPAGQAGALLSALLLAGLPAGPLVCDYEAPGVTDAHVRLFLATLRARGRLCGLYGSRDALYHQVDGRWAGKRLGQSFRWLASWVGTRGTVPPQPAAPAPKLPWLVWQYTDGGGQQDYDVWRGTEAQLAQWWARQGRPIVRPRRGVSAARARLIARRLAKVRGTLLEIQHEL